MTTTANTAEYLTCAATAKLLRAALKTAFPGVKFNVRSSNYSMGSSIDVYYTGGPSAADVERLGQFYTGSTFDGMTDSTSHHDTLLANPDGTIRQVHFAPDFVFAHRQEG